MKLSRIFFIVVPLLMMTCISCEQQNKPNFDNELYSINLDGTGLMNITIGNQGGSYSLAGNKIIYDFISSINIDGTDQQKLVPGNIFSNNNIPTDYSISSDGSKIVFTSIPGRANLYLMNRDGSNFNKINLPDSTSSKYSPQFSYDDNNIIFYTSDGIYESGINGENYKKILNNSSQEGIKYIGLHFSPDDNNIIYVEYNDSTNLYVSFHLFNLTSMHDTVFFKFTQSSWDYYEVSPNNSVLFITDGSIHEINLNDFSDRIIALGTDAHYSPNFNYITYIDPNNISFDLLNLKTGNRQNIKPGDKFSQIEEPRLSPDGTKIIFVGIKQVSQ